MGENDYQNVMATCWQCRELCPDCEENLMTDGRLFWCVSCGWQGEQSIDADRGEFVEE